MRRIRRFGGVGWRWLTTISSVDYPDRDVTVTPRLVEDARSALGETIAFAALVSTTDLAVRTMPATLPLRR